MKFMLIRLVIEPTLTILYNVKYNFDLLRIGTNFSNGNPNTHGVFLGVLACIYAWSWPGFFESVDHLFDHVLISWLLLITFGVFRKKLSDENIIKLITFWSPSYRMIKEFEWWSMERNRPFCAGWVLPKLKINHYCNNVVEIKRNPQINRQIMFVQW